MNETIICGLIKGRHEMPVDTYIFNEAIANVMDFHAIRNHIFEFLKTYVGISTSTGTGINQFDYTDVQVFFWTA